MIDQLRGEIQQRLDQLLAEADKLQRALRALSRDGSAPAPAATQRMRSLRRTNRSAQSTSQRARRAGRPRRSGPRREDSGPAASAASAPLRGRGSAPSAAGAGARSRQTKSTILAALSNGEAMTAGDVAAVTGLGRASVSTTLSKLAKAGEVTKADRGYQRAAGQ